MKQTSADRKLAYHKLNVHSLYFHLTYVVRLPLVTGMLSLTLFGADLLHSHTSVQTPSLILLSSITHSCTHSCFQTYAFHFIYSTLTHSLARSLSHTNLLSNSPKYNHETFTWSKHRMLFSL